MVQQRIGMDQYVFDVKLIIEDLIYDYINVVLDAFGWEACDVSILCDTSRGLTCVNNTCECGSLYYWDNVTAFWCEQKVIPQSCFLFLIFC